MLGFYVHVEGNLCTCMFLLKTIVYEQMQVFEHQTQCTCILYLSSAPHLCCMNLHVFLLMKDNFTDQIWVSKGWGSLLKNLFNGINHEIDYSYFQCLILVNVNTRENSFVYKSCYFMWLEEKWICRIFMKLMVPQQVPREDKDECWIPPPLMSEGKRTSMAGDPGGTPWYLTISGSWRNSPGWKW